MDDNMTSNTKAKREDAPAIGIDLGSSKCCVGVVRDGKVTIIENERGSKITPSYVAFTKMMRIIGEDAKNQASQNPTNTVFGVKRIIGRSFDDTSLKDVKDKFPFTIKNKDGKPRIEVFYKEKMIDLCPEQVSAMLLTKMKLIAESHLKCEVTDAVISVPAYFTNAQRQATKDAAAIAGLKVLGLINEPTAAALAYRDNMGLTDETICVVDLGGGKLDVSIITLTADDGIRVEQTMGDTALGGMDFDHQLADHFVRIFRETTNQNVSKKGFERVRLECEKLKHKLSLLPTAKIQLDCLAMDTDLEFSVDRKTFEDLCRKDLISVLQREFQCTKPGSNGERVKKFTKVIVVGGSTRIPLVQDILKEVLGKSLDQSVNPDEAVAHGAAIKAAMLAGDKFLKEVKLQEVTAHAIKMEIGNFMEDVLQQNGHETQKLFTPPPELDFNAPFTLYEYFYNAKRNTTESYSLGSVKFSDLSKLPFSEMVFNLDDSGIFCKNIAVDKNQYSIPFHSDYLNADQLKSLRIQEEDFQADEETEKERLVSLSNLGENCYSLKNLIEGRSVDDDSEKKDNKKNFIDYCDGTLDWLDRYPEASKGLCESKNKKLQDKYNDLVQPSNNKNEIETKKKNIPSVDNTKPPSETTQMLTQRSTKMYPNFSSLQNNERLGREEDFQDNRLNKQGDGDVGGQQTLQRDGDAADGLPTGNNINRSNGTYYECYDAGENTSEILDQKSLAPQAPVVHRDTHLDSISSTEIIPFIEYYFTDESASSVDCKDRNTSVEPDVLRQSGPTTTISAVLSDVKKSITDKIRDVFHRQN